MDKNTKDAFQNLIIENALQFSVATANLLEAMFGLSCEPKKDVDLESGLLSDKDFFVSVFFTGMVYGEYVIAMNEETAAVIVGQTLKGKSGEELEKIRQEISQAFCEFLNIVVGESIVGLIHVYQKITLTPPRSFFGTINYPKVMTGKVGIVLESGNVDCYLYVDRMRLDIASSYKEALKKVLSAHKELKEAMSKLQLQQTILVQSEKMAALGTMAAGVAHEINTPLATVSIIGDKLKDMLVEVEVEVDRSKFISSLDMIENTIQKIAKITNGMRDFAYGVKNEKMTDILLQELFHTALLGCDLAIKKDNILFKNEVSPVELSIECLAPEISQVFFSLISNSIDAIRKLPEKWIRIEALDLGENVEVRISDSGKGIPADIALKIFDPFFTTKDIGYGAGLGLSMAKGVIDAHCGDIKLDETSEHTCFVIHLPKKARARKTA